MHYGHKGTAFVKAHPMYKKVDAFVDFEDKFAIVLRHSLDIYAKVGNNMKPVVSKVFFMYDCLK